MKVHQERTDNPNSPFNQMKAYTKDISHVPYHCWPGFNERKSPEMNSPNIVEEYMLCGLVHEIRNSPNMTRTFKEKY